jgi:hypothetical protein
MWWMPPPGMLEAVQAEPTTIPYGYQEPDWRPVVAGLRAGPAVAVAGRRLPGAAAAEPVSRVGVVERPTCCEINRYNDDPATAYLVVCRPPQQATT